MHKLPHHTAAAKKAAHDRPRSRCTSCGIRSNRIATYAHTGPLFVRRGGRMETLPGVELVAAGEAVCPRCLDDRTNRHRAAERTTWGGR